MLHVCRQCWNHGPDPPYVAVFPDPSVAGSLKSARENSSALDRVEGGKNCF